MVQTFVLHKGSAFAKLLWGRFEVFRSNKFFLKKIQTFVLHKGTAFAKGLLGRFGDFRSINFSKEICECFYKDQRRCYSEVSIVLCSFKDYKISNAFCKLNGCSGSKIIFYMQALLLMIFIQITEIVGNKGTKIQWSPYRYLMLFLFSAVYILVYATGQVTHLLMK